MKLHIVGYNSQRNNFSFGGKFQGYKQCFSTSAFMFISFYSKKIISGSDDQLAWYVDQVEASVGTRGIAENVIGKIPWIPFSGSSYWWDVQKSGINSVFEDHGVKKIADWYNKGTWDQFDSCLNYGPIIVGTKKIGGLPGGHIVLCIGKYNDSYYLNDPYGNPLSNYSDENGSCIKVQKEWFRMQCENTAGRDKVRFMYAKER
jgi:hypothetical protein